MDFDAILEEIRNGVLQLAKNTVKDFLNDAQEDAESFLQQTKGDIERWTLALAEGRLTQQEFRFLLEMRKDLAQMHALTSVGVAATRIERFRKGLISLIVKSVFAAIPL